MRDAFFLGLLPFAILACSDSSDGDGDGTGRVSIVLTDAPGNIRAAVVTIDEIYLQGSNGRTVLRDRDTTVNLLTLANDAATIVDQAIVPAGSYEQLRFVISGAYIEVEGDGGGSEIYATSPDYAGLPAGAVVTGELRAPSLGQSGLKVQLGGDDSFVVTEDAAIVLVDFDVSQSFGHQAGNSGRWVMHPVIKGATITTAATIVVNVALGSGVTLPDIGGNPTTLAAFNATVTNSGSTTETLQLSDPESDGTWTATFNYLLPGTYSVGVTPPAGMTITTDPGAAGERQCRVGDHRDGVSDGDVGNRSIRLGVCPRLRCGSASVRRDTRFTIARPVVGLDHRSLGLAGNHEH